MQQSLITGMGIWSCIGTSCAQVTEALRIGRPGIGIVPERTAYGYQSPLSGIVPAPDLKNEPLRNAQRRTLSEPSAYGYMAVKQALAQSGLTDLSRVALIVSNDSTAEAMADTEALMALHHDTRRLGGFQVFRSLNSTVSMSLASIFGIGGLSLSVSAACAGGGHAIGIAHSLIQSGIIDCAIIVGTQEVGIHAYTSFDALGVFSQRTDDPSAASRPFDSLRDGLVPSGGAACIILESPQHLAARTHPRPVSSPAMASPSSDPSSAPSPSPIPLAAVIGYGFSTSPNIVTPSPESILAAMQMALGCPYEHVAAHLSTIFPHATSTRDGDMAEAKAITALLASIPDHPLPLPMAFGLPVTSHTTPTAPSASAADAHASAASPASASPAAAPAAASSRHPRIVPTKALTGHECWMSGVSQVVYAVLQQQGHFVAPHPNLRHPDPAACFDIPTTPQSYDHTLYLCNAFGFGGTNASLLLAAPSLLPLSHPE